MLSDIAFQEICDNYYLGQFDEFSIVIMKDSSWVNASKLCRDGGKQLKNWLRLDHSKELMRACWHQAHGFTHPVPVTHGDAAAHIRAAVCKYTATSNITDNDRLICGTYCHPDLVPSIAGWISPEFQLKVNRIINNFYVNEYKKKLEAVEQLLHLKQQEIQEAQQIVQDNQKITILTEDLIDKDTKRIAATEALTAKKHELRN